MKKVEAYEADDGTLCRTEEDAQALDASNYLREWYSNNELFGASYGCVIEFDGLLNWLEEHAGTIPALIRLARLKK